MVKKEKSVRFMVVFFLCFVLIHVLHLLLREDVSVAKMLKFMNVFYFFDNCYFTDIMSPKAMFVNT